MPTPAPAAPPAIAAAQPAPRPIPQFKPQADVGFKPLHIPELEPELLKHPAPPITPEPIRKRIWLLILLGLAAIWMLAKPDNGKQIDARIDAAISMASDCKIDAARAELVALKAGKAKPKQWKRLQKAIAETGPACDKKQVRARAWSEAVAAVDGALQAAAFDKAISRLATFVRRWGTDADARDLGDRIGKEKGEHLLAEADACLARSDRVCLENRVLAAERLHRPELATRIATLRISLSRLLESTLFKASVANDKAPQQGR